VFGKANQDIKEAATGAAVAAIANSNDPMAQQAATPNTWQFDPLAVATAANAREGQLRTQELQDLSKQNTTLQMKQTQAELDDREAQRQSEDLALPYRTPILAGEKVEIDRTDPRWATAAGKLALDRIDNWYKEFNDNKYKQDSLALERARAAREMRNEAESKALDDAIGRLVKRAGSAEGAAWDPATYDRIVGEEFERSGVSLRHLDLGRGAINLGISGNKPSDAELDSENAALGSTTRDFIKWQDTRAADIQQQTRNNISQYNSSLRAGQLMANNPYMTADGKYLSDDEAAQAFITKTKAGDGAFAKDWTASDVKERVTAIADWSKREGLTLTRPQLFLLAESTVGQLTPMDSVTWGPMSIINNSLIADARDFNDLNNNGDIETVNAKIAAQKAEEAKALAALQRDTRLVEASSRNPEIKPPERLVREYREDPVRKRDATSASLALVRNQEEALRRELASGNKAVAPALQAVSAQVKKLERQLEAMK
jgi:hypothetical protein